MSFDTPTNRRRADKIVEIVGHLKRSAGANKPTSAEVAEIMAPAVEALRALGAIPAATDAPAADIDAAIQTTAFPPPPPIEAGTPGGAWSGPRNAPAYTCIRDAAARAPLHDLTYAMAVYLGRIDEEFHKGGA